MYDILKTIHSPKDAYKYKIGMIIFHTDFCYFVQIEMMPIINK